MKNLFLFLSLLLIFSCKKKSGDTKLYKPDTTYSYNQSLANLGIITNKIYTLRFIDSSSFSISPGDTIIFNTDSTITEITYVDTNNETGMPVYKDIPFNYRVSMYFDTLGNYYLAYNQPLSLNDTYYYYYPYSILALFLENYHTACFTNQNNEILIGEISTNSLNNCNYFSHFSL